MFTDLSNSDVIFKSWRVTMSYGWLNMAIQKEVIWSPSWWPKPLKLKEILGKNNKKGYAVDENKIKLWVYFYCN